MSGRGARAPDPTASLGRALVVGGTGMLAPASAWVAARARHLVLVARRPDVLARRLGAVPVALDWSDPAAADALPPGPFDLLITWVHARGTWLVRHAEGRLRPHGRSIRVHPSAALDPAVRRRADPPPPREIRRQHVVLTWIDGPGGRRWLTHDEISGGVIEAAADPDRAVIVVGDG